MTTIEFKHVNYDKILTDVTGIFTHNKITALVGPSGAGKSTVLKHINGLVSPTDGDIFIDKKSIKDIDIINLRRNIGFAFQSSPMLEGTVYDNLKFPKELFKETFTKEEGKQLLHHVGLDDTFLNQPVRKLSGGEKSRVALARTLVNEPDIMLLDEITASVDYRLSRELETLILKLKEDHNLTVIWVTHNLEQAKRVSDNLWFLKDGQLLEQGPISILEQPQTNELKQFLEGED